MDRNDLLELHRLLSKWIDDPDWNPDSAAWSCLVECRRQAEIDLRAMRVEIPA